MYGRKAFSLKKKTAGSMEDSELTLSLKDVEDIGYIAVTNLLVTENVPHSTFQTLLVLRALEKFLKDRHIDPQFVIDLTPKPRTVNVRK